MERELTQPIDEKDLKNIYFVKEPRRITPKKTTIDETLARNLHYLKMGPESAIID